MRALDPQSQAFFLARVRGMTTTELEIWLRELLDQRRFDARPKWLAKQGITALQRENIVALLRVQHAEYLPMCRLFIQLVVAVLRERRNKPGQEKR